MNALIESEVDDDSELDEDIDDLIDEFTNSFSEKKEEKSLATKGKRCDCPSELFPLVAWPGIQQIQHPC